MSDTNTGNFLMDPITKGGYPNVVDQYLQQAIASAKSGGAETQAFFDTTNQTSGFWNWMADHDGSQTDPFVDGHDVDGNPIVMASNGNVSMRMGAFYRGDEAQTSASGDPPPVVGTGTIQLGNTTISITRDLSFGLSASGALAGIPLTKQLFGDLLKPLYANMKTFVKKMAKQFQEASQSGVAIDPMDESEAPIDEASGEIEEVGGELAEQGVEYLVVDWSAATLEAAGLGALAVIPMLVSFLGHEMTNSVIVINQTNLDFTWNISYIDSGELTVEPKDETGRVIPKMSYYTDMWGDETSVEAAYEADFQLKNKTDMGAIGYVLTLSPSDGGTPAQVVVSIPWAGENTIWLGTSSDSPDTIFHSHKNPNGNLSVSATMGSYQTTVAISKLSGTTNGKYFYGIMIVLEQES